MKSLRTMAAVLAFTALVLCPIARAAEATPSPAPYPLTTCIVSDDKLGDMGKPISIDYRGQQVSFCCKSCIGEFEKAPAKYLAKLTPKAQP